MRMGFRGNVMSTSSDARVRSLASGDAYVRRPGRVVRIAEARTSRGWLALCVDIAGIEDTSCG